MKGQVIYIENIPFENFTKIKVFQSANQHMEAEFSGVISKEFATDYEKLGYIVKSVSVDLR